MAEAPKIPAVNKWIVAMTVMVPTFIEVMDISVVNVSLPHIQGSLNAGLDEVTWVLTSYPSAAKSRTRPVRPGG